MNNLEKIKQELLITVKTVDIGLRKNNELDFNDKSIKNLKKTIEQDGLYETLNGHLLSIIHLLSIEINKKEELDLSVMNDKKEIEALKKLVIEYQKIIEEKTEEK